MSVALVMLACSNKFLTYLNVCADRQFWRKILQETENVKHSQRVAVGPTVCVSNTELFVETMTSVSALFFEDRLQEFWRRI